MKRPILIALASCLAVGAQGQPAPSAVKWGLWEVDGEMTVSGPNADSPAAKLMRSMGKPVKHTECVLPARAARGPVAVVYFDDDPNCANQDQHMEGRELVFSRVCKVDGKAGPPDAVRISAEPDEIPRADQGPPGRRPGGADTGNLAPGRRLRGAIAPPYPCEM